MRNGTYSTKPDQDLLAFGGGNIAAGLTGGFAVGSSTSRTAALDQAGSRTQLPSIVTAVGTLALVVFGTALLEHIPSAAIGAIVGVAVLPLLGIAELRQLWGLDRAEFLVAAVCFLGSYSRARPEIIARIDHFGLLKEGATVYRTNREALAGLIDMSRRPSLNRGQLILGLAALPLGEVGSPMASC